MSNFPPCKHCEVREPGCHSLCKAYLDYKKIQENILKSKRAYNNSIGDLTTSIGRSKRRH